MTIWEDSEDNCYLNTMLRLVIWLNKPLSRYYRDDEYLKGLNDMNTIIGMNIHSLLRALLSGIRAQFFQRPVTYHCPVSFIDESK